MGPDSLVELACNQGDLFSGTSEIILETLVPGQTYFLRIQSVNPGTYRYCLRNFSPEPDRDCPTARLVCDTTPVQVDYFYGNGLDDTELDSATCLDNSSTVIPVESASHWFAFQAYNNDSLEFTLIPNDPADDIDFVIYRLPNGQNNCTGKVLLRCMASGDSDPASPCMGPTGLDAISIDTFANGGCTGLGDDAFLLALPLETGQWYALAVINYSGGGNYDDELDDGFRLEWSGSAQLGPPRPVFPADTTIFAGQKLTLSVEGAFGPVTWTSGQDIGNGPSITVMPEDSTTYLVLVQGESCAATDTVQVAVRSEIWEIPNVFTPNGDSHNDLFKPVLEGGSLRRMQIWSRWGELIYDDTTMGTASGWNGLSKGLPAPADAYIYRMEVVDATGQVRHRSGEVTLLR